MSAAAARPRLAIVVSHPTQYYSPWFRWLAEHEDFHLRVFYLWNFGVTAQRDPRFQTTFRWDVDLLSGYDSEFVPNIARHPGAESFWGFNNPSLHGAVQAFRPDALLLFGYQYLTHLRLIWWAKRHRLPLIFRGDSHLLGRTRPRGWRGFAVRRVYQQFSAITYVGAANRDYFTALGVPEQKLFFAPHAVDSRRFTPTPDLVQQADEHRRALQIPSDTTVILFAGKFVADKQPMELLEAFLASVPERAVLLFVGDGPEKNALITRAADALGRKVHIQPFANQSEMPRLYAVADLFVLPSRGHYETWGLAVNEAMSMGVPCLVSDRVGCQRDLVIDGETGWVFRTEDPEHLRVKLNEALRAVESDAQGWSDRTRARVAAYSYAAASEGLRNAVGSTLTQSRT